MEKLKEILLHDRFATGAGVELMEVREGYAKARMQVTEKHLNAGGVCQGGALFTLADLAFAAVANSRRQLTLSLNAQITFLSAVVCGWVYAEAEEIFSHARIPFIEVRITNDEGKLVAMLTSSGYRKKENLF